MISDHDKTTNTCLIPYHPPSATYRPPQPFRSRLSFRRRRQRRLPVARLGGGGKKARKGFFLVRLFRRIKLKSLKVKYMKLLKKLKVYYSSLLKDMIDGAATIESFQQRALWEASYAVPAMGFTFGTLPPHYSYVG